MSFCLKVFGEKGLENGESPVGAGSAGALVISLGPFFGVVLFHGRFHFISSLLIFFSASGVLLARSGCGLTGVVGGVNLDDVDGGVNFGDVDGGFRVDVIPWILSLIHI